MRIFVVNQTYEKAEMYEQMLQSNVIDVRECDDVWKALKEAQNFTEDKISVIIVNAAEEKDQKEKVCKKQKSNPLLQVQTFGNFEVFYEGQPVRFQRKKSKELLAYLIDRRGAMVTTAEACAVLWEDKEYNFSLQRQFQTIVSDLMKSLRKYECAYIVHRRRNGLAIDVSELECDIYKLLAGDKNAAIQYNGEYMSNYSWAEMTAGFLAQKYGSGAKNHRN